MYVGRRTQTTKIRDGPNANEVGISFATDWMGKKERMGGCVCFEYEYILLVTLLIKVCGLSKASSI